MYFKDRRDAGKQLSQFLLEYKDTPCVVFALPRGGVPVAVEIAKTIHAPLELILAHKIGHPYQPEYAVAAVSESGHVIHSPREQQFMDDPWFESAKKHEMEEIKRKRGVYLKDKAITSLKGKIAIIVDDGVATGLTMQVGIKELQVRHPDKIIVAVPVAPKSTVKVLKKMADDFVGYQIEDCEFLGAVGAYYGRFEQTSDEEVIGILQGHAM